MGEPQDYHTKWNKSERERQRMKKTNTIWYWLYVESKICYKWTYLKNRKQTHDIENQLIVTKGEKWGGVN